MQQFSHGFVRIGIRWIGWNHIEKFLKKLYEIQPSKIIETFCKVFFKNAGF